VEIRGGSSSLFDPTPNLYRGVLAASIAGNIVLLRYWKKRKEKEIKGKESFDSGSIDYDYA